ncbi:MAG: hypothetical protein WBW33_25010 [Bryobacteraceae bacterium]
MRNKHVDRNGLTLSVGLALLGLMLRPPSVKATDPADASEVALAFNGGSTWTSGTTGICIWYFPVVGDLDLKFLFAPDMSGAPVIDREHAYFIWVSDFSVQFLTTPPVPKGAPATVSYALALAPAGEGTIYYSNNPSGRDWSDLTKRSTWGAPVAKFVRKGSLVRSADGFVSDTFIFSADLKSATRVDLNGKHFDFRDLLPSGMTCFEFGQMGSSRESGNCLAKGGGRQGNDPWD